MSQLFKKLFGTWGKWQDLAIYAGLHNNKYLIQIREHSSGRKKFSCRRIHGYPVSVSEFKKGLINIENVKP